MEFTIGSELLLYLLEALLGIIIALLGIIFKSSLKNIKDDMMGLEAQIKSVDACVKSNEKDLANLYVRQDVYKANNETIIQRFDNLDKSINKMSDQMIEYQTTIIDLIKNKSNH
jgi:translation initiation factor 2B subunit (eIF-2B alpha/beta/delta family)